MIATASPYEKLSREELVVTVVKLRHELDQLKRLVFGSKHERFIPSSPPEQLALGLAVEQINPTQAISKTVEYSRTITKPDKPVPTGRMKLPAGLPRERIVIAPAEDVTGLKSIGEEITEELDYTPGKFFVRQYARPKYVRPLQKNGLTETEIIIAPLPTRPLDKCIAGAALLAWYWAAFFEQVKSRVF